MVVTFLSAPTVSDRAVIMTHSYKLQSTRRESHMRNVKDWSHHIHNTEAERDGCWRSDHFLLLSQSPPPSHGTVLPRLSVSPPQFNLSGDAFTRCPEMQLLGGLKCSQTTDHADPSQPQSQHNRLAGEEICRACLASGDVITGITKRDFKNKVTVNISVHQLRILPRQKSLTSSPF